MAFSFNSMWNYRCPRCRHGSIFSKPFQLSKPLEMPKKCEYCGQVTTPEPGFYYGAMFLSYILSSWFVLIPTLVLVFYFKWSVGGAMAIAIALTAVTYLKFLRGSRSLWLHMMVKHDSKVEEEVSEKIEMRKNTAWKPNVNKQDVNG